MKLAQFLIAAALSLLSVTVNAQSSASVSNGASSQRLLREYATADNFRAFALQAKARPGEGGIFYANYVANLCGREYSVIAQRGNAAIAKHIDATGTIPSWQLAKIEYLPRRCSGFLAGEAHALVNELKRVSVTSDPLLAAEKDLRTAARSGGRDQIRSAMARAMEIDDPLLWTSQRLWDVVAQSDTEAKKSLGFYLGGVVYSEKDGLKHLEAYTALELGFCKPDLPCALDDELSIICAIGGACAQDRDAKAKSLYLDNGGSEEGWKKVLTLVAQVRTALATRNVAFFVR
ncbi:MAG: hypothetical protein V4787_11445 [Pseudomonadota bacterium]